MHSDLIGKIEKARRYAQEPERIVLDGLNARFHGGNNDHQITLTEGRWSCDCDFFRLRHTCAHVMAFQKIFDQMLTAEARQFGWSGIDADRMAGSLS